MGNEIKKISVNAFERVVKESNEYNTAEVEWYGEKIIVKRRLSLEEMMYFVNGVVDNCFADDESYLPEVKEFSIRCGMLEMYGNFRLPTNVSSRYALVFSEAGTLAYDLIAQQIDLIQFEEIQDVIEEKIDYRVNTSIEKANRQINELVNSLMQMEEQMKGIFGDMTADEMNGLIGSLLNGVDEEKLMKAYMEYQAGNAAEGAEDNVVPFSSSDSKDGE